MGGKFTICARVCTFQGVLQNRRAAFKEEIKWLIHQKTVTFTKLLPLPKFRLCL